MVKTDKYFGMADMFEQLDKQQLIAQKTADFNKACAEIEAEIRSNRENINFSDPNDARETENDIMFLERKLDKLRREYEKEIASLNR